MTRRLQSFTSKLLGVRAHDVAQPTVEVELSVAPRLCNPEKISLDIGADLGGYASLICSYSARCIAFEPRQENAASIRNLAANKGLRIAVEPVALSDTEGMTELRVLTRDPGRSTIEPSNNLEDSDGSPRSSVSVIKKCLDSYGLKNVGFIKIDVEGHELAVLVGARNTIEASMPNLLIEIEERHSPGAIDAVGLFLTGLGYEGFFIVNGEVRPFSEFDKAVHQDPANIGGWRSGWRRFGTYINNFFFLPAGSGDVLRRAVDASRASREAGIGT